MSDDAAFIASVEALAPWVGRQRIVEDDIGLMAVRRIASMLDLDPDSFVGGTPLPPHWFTMFFGDCAKQSDIGADGHPNPGVVLPPIPLPRRMGAGRRVTIKASLRAGEPARKIAEVAAIVPKIARTGRIAVLTMRHTIEARGEVIAVDEFDAVYREAPPPGQKSTATVPAKAPADAAWSETKELSSPLVFRYSAVTWNAHKIHYDADYSRETEGYPQTVQNGGLTMQLLLDAAIRNAGCGLTGYTARLTSPLYVGQTVTLAGRGVQDGRMAVWAANADGSLCAEMGLEFA